MGVITLITHTRISGVLRLGWLGSTRLTCMARPRICANNSATRRVALRWRTNRFSMGGSFGFRVSHFERPELETQNWKLETFPAACDESVAYSMEIFRKSLKSLSILPVPSTTEHSVSSAIDT